MIGRSRVQSSRKAKEQSEGSSRNRFWFDARNSLFYGFPRVTRCVFCQEAEPLFRSLGQKEFAVSAIAINLTALTVAMIFYTYRDGYLGRLRRSRILHERVAYLLWNAAQHSE